MEKQKASMNAKSTGQWLMNNAIYVVLIGLIVIIAVREPGFLRPTNFINILTHLLVS